MGAESEYMDLPNTKYVREIKAKIQDIPPLPQVATKALELLLKEEPDLTEMINVISLDPAIAGKVLSYANSPLYTRVTPITDLKKAVIVMGVKEVKDVILKIVTNHTIIKLVSKGLSALQSRLSKHSVLTAIIGELCLEKVNPSRKAEAFVAGLLHDIGKFLLLTLFEDEYGDIFKKTDTSFIEMEQDRLGVDHSLVGKWLAEHWNIPSSLLHSIWLHHHDSDTIRELKFLRDEQLVYTVCLANRLSHIISVDNIYSFKWKDEIHALISVLQLRDTDLKGILEKAPKILAATGPIYDIEEDHITFYVKSLSNAFEYLYSVSKLKDGFKNIEKEKLRLKQFIAFIASATGLIPLETLMAKVGEFLRQDLLTPKGVILLCDLSSKKVKLLDISSGENVYEFHMSKFFEKNIDYKLDESLMSVISKLLSMISDQYLKSKHLATFKIDNFYILSIPITNVINSIFSFIIPEQMAIDDEIKTLLNYLILIVRDKFEFNLMVSEVKKASESLAMALTKNSEVMAKLRQKTKEYEDLFEYSNDPIVLHLTSGEIIRVNSRFKELLGIDDHTTWSFNLLDLIINSDPTIKNTLATKWASEEGCKMEVLLKRSENLVIPVQISSRAISQRGDLVQSIFRDLSAEKKIVEQLNSERHRLTTTLMSIGEGVIVTDKNFSILIINSIAEKLLGVKKEDVVGMSLAKVFNVVTDFEKGDVVDKYIKLHEASEVKASSYVGKLFSTDGKYYPITYRISPIIDSEQNFYGIILVFSDQSEKLKMKEKLYDMQKWESLALLSAGVAHDFNNIMTAIAGNISIAKMNLNKPDKVKEKLTLAEVAVEKARELTSQLLTYSKTGSIIRRKSVPTKSLIIEATNFCLRGSAVQCEFDFSRDLWNLDCDPGQINQAINNLVINAQEAMPKGGKIYIQARNLRIPQDLESEFLPGGKYVEIKVQDEGEGIPEHILGKIFDPYFTTKEGGSGLGLATTYGIVKKHGGDILVSSEVGKGTVFTIILPAVEGQSYIESQGSSVPILKGQGKVLIMDDDPQVRETAKAIFETLGFDVVTALSGEDTLKILQSSTEVYRLVILDLTVKGGAGAVDVVDHVRSLGRCEKVLLSTGYVENEEVKDYKAYGFDGVIEKPYNVDKVNLILRDLFKVQ